MTQGKRNLGFTGVSNIEETPVSVYIGVKFQELLTPLGLLAFIYFANLIAFKIESYQAKEFLLALFEAQKTKP